MPDPIQGLTDGCRQSRLALQHKKDPPVFAGGSFHRKKGVTLLSPEEAKILRETNPFDPRNVRDRFKNKSNDYIKRTVDSSRSELVLCLSNQVRDINLSNCIRSANSFNIDHVVMAGHKRYDRRGTVGAHHYIDVVHEPDLHLAIMKYHARGYRIVALEHDQRYQMHNVINYKWHKKTFLIAGEEGMTLSHSVLTAADDIVYIPMHGTVRSLNLASAVSIALYDYEAKQ